MAALCALVFSCSKEQATIDNPSKVSASKEIPVRYTLNSNHFTTPGIEPKPTVNEFVAPDKPFTEPTMPSTNILTPTREYLKETCLFDISHLDVSKSYHQINNKNLNISFSSIVSRLKSDSSAYGWPAHWGYLPYVESEAPNLLYSSMEAEIIVVLSKPCIEFGFEASPDMQIREFGFSFFAGNYPFDSSAGLPGALTHTPSGARLIAVKATKPFTVLTIVWGRSSSVDSPPGGIAMANIRYKLAK